MQRGCAWIGHALILLLPDLLSIVYHILPTYFSEAVLVAPQTVADVLDTLKFDRDEFLRKVAE